MCKELNEEIQRGQRAFEQIAEHLYAMGAEVVEQSVIFQNGIYKITCERIDTIETTSIKIDND